MLRYVWTVWMYIYIFLFFVYIYNIYIYIYIVYINIVCNVLYVCIHWNLPPPSNRTQSVHVSEGLSFTVSLVLQGVGGWGRTQTSLFYCRSKVTHQFTTCTDLINMLDDWWKTLVQKCGTIDIPQKVVILVVSLSFLSGGGLRSFIYT